MYFEDHSFIKSLLRIVRRRNSFMNSYSTLNKMKHYIVARYARKPVANSSLRKETHASFQHKKENNLLNLKKMLHFVLNRQKPNFYFPVSKIILKFHFQETMLENFFLKHGRKLLSIAKKVVSKEELEKQWGGPEAYKLILFIKDDFHEVVNKNPSVIVFFSADWCRHCLTLRIPFGTAALMAKEANLPIVFATLDVTSNPNIADENGVVGIPTFKFYKNGKIASTFKGKRTADDLFAFVKNPTQIPKEVKKADV